MAATPLATAAATPASQPMNARTPNHSNTTALATSTSTPHANSSQDPSQSLNLSFPTAVFESQDLANPAAKPFPPASTFTFIPDLYKLISRLRLLEGTPQFTGSGAANITGSRAGTLSPLLNRDGGTATIKADLELSETQPLQVTATTTSSGPKPAENNSDGKSQVLDIKDLPENVYEIRQAIQHAREVVAGLPGINRTISEQEIEIDLLKRQIGGLRKRVGELANLARDEDGPNKIQTQDVVMQGVEDAG